MKPFQANLINAVTLIGLGLWGYFSTQSPTALISPAFGALLLLMTPGVRSENKIIAHIAVTLTLLILIALIKPLTGGGDTLAKTRVGIMMLTSLIAMITFIRSFIAARKAKA